MAATDHPGDPRPVSTIRAELADLERYLATTPPHAAGDLSRGIAARRDALQRELTRALDRPPRSAP